MMIVTSSIHFRAVNKSEPYLQNISLFYRENDTVPDKQIGLRNITIIKKFPYLLYLLTQLFYYKDHFSNNELHALLAYFDADVKNTVMYKSFYSYFNGAANFDKAYPAGVQLKDTLDVFSQVGNNTSPFNLFVFWASWCGPCRKKSLNLKNSMHYIIKRGWLFQVSQLTMIKKAGRLLCDKSECHGINS